MIAMQQQAEQYLKQLTPETLVLATDFLAYLVQKDEDRATEELLNIEGFQEIFERGKQQVAEGKVTNWREIRNVYEVKLSDEARDFYATTDQATAKKIAKCFSQLEQNS